MTWMETLAGQTPEAVFHIPEPIRLSHCRAQEGAADPRSGHSSASSSAVHSPGFFRS